MAPVFSSGEVLATFSPGDVDQNSSVIIADHTWSGPGWRAWAYVVFRFSSFGPGSVVAWVPGGDGLGLWPCFVAWPSLSISLTWSCVVPWGWLAGFWTVVAAARGLFAFCLISFEFIF